jgi:uncharacterized Ntn-hydrolase superfamily protein
VTFSILGRCARTGAFGIAVSSSSIAIGARCGRWARAGVGACATQNITDPALGALGLDLLARGYEAEATLQELVRAGAHPEFRQLAVLDIHGRSAYHAGAHALGIHAMQRAPDCIASGNLLKHDGIPRAMVEAFVAQPERHVGERVLAALAAGLAAGGETGPLRGASVYAVDRLAWPVIDLRVDWHDDPIGELQRVLALYLPQMNDYVLRAVEPTRAPGFDASKSR